MRKSFRVLAMVVGGVVGGWIGYWLGYALGWSTDAQWPWRIGAGTGAIVLSMAMAVLGVLLVGAVIALPPYLTERRLRAGGESIESVDATVLEGWSLGLQANGIHVHRHLYAFLVEMAMPDGSTRIAHATQWLTPEEFEGLRTRGRARALVDRDHPGRVLVTGEPSTGVAVT